MKAEYEKWIRMVSYAILAGIALGAILIVGKWAIRAFVADQFIIPSESMMPTLMPGDRVVVNKLVAGARIYTDFHFDPEGGKLQSVRLKGLRKIRRNDVVVFNYPKPNGKISFRINLVYAKRCVALPGDTLAVHRGFYRNNRHKGVLGIESEQQRLSETPDSLIPEGSLKTYPYDEHFPWTIKEMGPFYVPRKGDVVPITPMEGTLYRLILEYETGKPVEVDWETGRVYAGKRLLRQHCFRHNYYFMCGDNVMNSCDARYWGFVPEEFIVGVVDFISYSRDRRNQEMRWNRLLKKVH